MPREAKKRKSSEDIQEKLLPRLTFNPGLALTSFRTTRAGAGYR